MANAGCLGLVKRVGTASLSRDQRRAMAEVAAHELKEKAGDDDP